MATEGYTAAEFAAARGCSISLARMHLEWAVARGQVRRTVRVSKATLFEALPVPASAPVRLWERPPVRKRRR